MRQFVGQAVRDYMLQSGNYEQKLVVIGIANLGLIANSEAIRNGCVGIGTADSEVTSSPIVCLFFMSRITQTVVDEIS